MKINDKIDAAIDSAKPLVEVHLVSSNNIELPLPNKTLTNKIAKALVERLNEQFAVLKHGGKVVVLTFERRVHKVGSAEYIRLIAEFLKFSDFRNLLMHRKIKISSGDGTQLVSVGHWWLHQPDREQYDGLVFRPGDTRRVIDNKFNLWRGWGVEPKAGDWSLMKAHIREMMASSDQEHFEYILNWLAWCVQNPDQRAEVALVFRGKKGVGKGTLGVAMTRMFGQHGYHISSAGQLVGKHNAHLRDCCFLFADEALWPGDRGAEGNFKRMITEPTLDIEAKYFNSVQVPNMLHILIASNEDWVIPASDGERRYVMFDVSEQHKQDLAWFGPIYRQLDEGGLAAMLYDLLHHDLGEWHPRWWAIWCVRAPTIRRVLSAMRS